MTNKKCIKYNIDEQIKTVVVKRLNERQKTKKRKIRQSEFLT